MIPRYKTETGILYEVYLVCPDCGWAVTKDAVTKNWNACRNCGSMKIKTKRIEYGQGGK